MPASRIGQGRARVHIVACNESGPRRRIAQRRRKGDRHELNALRTWASAVRPPEPPRTLLLPQTLTLTAKHGTFVARQRNAGSFRRFRPRIKKNSFRTRAFGPFRDLSWKLFIPALMGRAGWLQPASPGGCAWVCNHPSPLPPCDLRKLRAQDCGGKPSPTRGEGFDEAGAFPLSPRGRGWLGP